jgi:hypothetical protein
MSATCYHLVHLDIFSPIVIPKLKIQVFWDVTPYRLVTSVKQSALRNVGKYLAVDLAKHPVGIATDYGLDGPEIESRWRARFCAHILTGPAAHPASCTMGTGSFPEVKRPGRGADHLPPSSAEVKKE